MTSPTSTIIRPGVNLPPPHPLRVLLAEDDALNRTALTFFLEQAGHTVIPAVNGRDVLAILETEPIHNIVMDVEMPLMDGITAAKLMRALAPRVGIVMLSLHGDAETRARAQAIGAAAFIEKGADEALLTAIRQAAYSAQH